MPPMGQPSPAPSQETASTFVAAWSWELACPSLLQGQLPAWGEACDPRRLSRRGVNSCLCLSELEEFAHFDFGVWRKRYMQWIGQMKSRVLDVFRGIDRDQDGRISQREFIESVLASKFPTNVLEMKAVASIFDLNGDGFIDYYEFVSALHPNRDPLRRTADADQIQDEGSEEERQL
nr:PREDICTED: microtubule-actin cross-linking factor 1-like [Struthio camelus australis]